MSNYIYFYIPTDRPLKFPNYIYFYISTPRPNIFTKKSVNQRIKKLWPNRFVYYNTIGCITRFSKFQSHIFTFTFLYYESHRSVLSKHEFYICLASSYNFMGSRDCTNVHVLLLLPQ